MVNPVEFRLCDRIIENMSQVVVGKLHAIELLLVALLADGHALIEDVPGLGKTLMAKALARTIGGTFKRVQFTPDLLPADSMSIISKPAILRIKRGRCSAIFYSPMRLTVRFPAPSPVCSRAWRSARLP